MSEIGKVSKVTEIFSYGELKLFLEKKEKVILFVGTDWCSQSKTMAEAIAELSGKFPEINFLVASLEGRDHMPLPAKKELKAVFGIESYPTLITFLRNEIVPAKKLVSEKSFEKQKKDVIALIKRAV